MIDLKAREKLIRNGGWMFRSSVAGFVIKRMVLDNRIDASSAVDSLYNKSFQLDDRLDGAM